MSKPAALTKAAAVSFSRPATALPTGVMSARRAAEVTAKLMSLDGRKTSRLRAMARLSGVRIRHGVVFDESTDADASHAPFYTARPKGAPPIPSTAERMELYAREAPPLAVAAARNALLQESLPPSAVTHLVVATCTGFFAPGLDCALVGELGLPPSTQRVSVGFMGCHAALNAAAVARGLALAHRDAVVLLVCVELCSLHFQSSLDRDSLVSNSLFADGAAAAILRSQSTARRSSIRLLDTASHLFPDSVGAMTWTIGDSGFRMTLDKSVPDLIAGAIGPVVDSFLERNGLHRRDVGGWAIHPGGPRILDASAEALGLRADAVRVSRDILKNHGNMSSPTILFILKALVDSGAKGPVLALAFGPGLVAELTLFEGRG